MKKALLMAALAAAVVGGALGCGGKDATNKAVSAAVKPDTMAAAPDTATAAIYTDTTFTDRRDGKVYRTVQVGGQTWFAENLNFAAEGSKCYENNPKGCAKYGRLYNWYTALKACPAGTHLPSDKEWAALVDYAGGEEKAGTKLKSAAGWNEDGNGTNDFGWSALPGGYGYSDGSFLKAGSNGLWWSATDGAKGVIYRGMDYDLEYVNGVISSETVLLSVRCVVDKEAQK